MKNEISREILPSRASVQGRIPHKILRRISCKILTDCARQNSSRLCAVEFEAQNLKPRCRKNKIRIKALRSKILSQNSAAKFQTPNLISQNSKRQILRRKNSARIFQTAKFRPLILRAQISHRRPAIAARERQSLKFCAIKFRAVSDPRAV
nr:hypothetical protein [uncultured Campylobacter sp.]